MSFDMAGETAGTTQDRALEIGAQGLAAAQAVRAVAAGAGDEAQAAQLANTRAIDSLA